MVQEKSVNGYGDGFSWIRGSMLGKGSFGSVYLATIKKSRSKQSYFPSAMAVKSAEVSVSGSIQKEREIFSNIQGCPDIIECFGEETTMGDNGVMAYNLLLEYGSGGTLATRIKKSNGKGLPEFEAKVYTRSLLRGLNHIHQIGYVHCDMKPDNILLVPNYGRNAITEFKTKIADFGLAKRAKTSKKRKLEAYWRGTPMYLSPEAVRDRVQKAPCDVWALGCIVLEMLTGKPVWDKGLKVEEILRKISSDKECPKIPNELSKEAKDFLKRCFMRRPMYRMTCEMLLSHPFLQGLENDDHEEVDEELEDDLDLDVDLDEVEYIGIACCESDDDEFSYGSELLAEDWFSYDDRICI
ncbi:hypothetical protein BUALT_Bualt12G0143600 [Buddleja alternifolia]|uniref:Protein kinase domain-containing protein n=1 Tax=Buddleja alternifolia TaxID=168488 RepID=A0AAV6WZC5_9LAMI|nr:hypothetical protein BUALT_Bualt12G0143600 [Buddleja alternifolia]